MAAVIESLGLLVGMTSDPFFDGVFLCGLGYAVSALVGSLVLDNMLASYGGKLSSPVFGMELDSRFGWWLMELPATLSFNYFYWQGKYAFLPVPLFLCFIFNKHYLNRGWFFPLSIRKAPGAKQSFSITVLLAGMLFTFMHGYLNATWFTELGTELFDGTSWCASPWFLMGYPVYEIAFIGTIHCELIMRNLRAPQVRQFDLSNTVCSLFFPSSCVHPVEPAVGVWDKKKQHKIPRGGAFEWATNPQYFFELLAWFSYMILSKNPAGLVVFSVSAANLVPRAFVQHQWYLEKFDEYPKTRKVIIPFVL